VAATHYIPPVSPDSDERAHEPPADTAVDTGTACDCGHIEGAHEHYRRGTDCALCPCARYRKSDRLRLRLRPE
jgi:hypothetical protein